MHYLMSRVYVQVSKSNKVVVNRWNIRLCRLNVVVYVTWFQTWFIGISHALLHFLCTKSIILGDYHSMQTEFQSLRNYNVRIMNPTISRRYVTNLMSQSGARSLVLHWHENNASIFTYWVFCCSDGIFAFFASKIIRAIAIFMTFFIELTNPIVETGFVALIIAITLVLWNPYNGHGLWTVWGLKSIVLGSA